MTFSTVQKVLARNLSSTARRPSAPRSRTFAQVDVFTTQPMLGNPVAVVLDGSDLSTTEMQQLAAWTNLSETTFVLPPSATSPQADYRVRIFTPTLELPFAGHPTIGTCHAWLQTGGVPAVQGVIVQECGVGLVRLRQGNRLAFSAPPLIKSGPVQPELVQAVSKLLQIDVSEIVNASWADNGPGWIAVMLKSGDDVLNLRPDFAAVESQGCGVVGEFPVGVVGMVDSSSFCFGKNVNTRTAETPDIVVRAFFRGGGGQPTEDPVTGSLNAALAQWLLGTGELNAPYVASQGTAIGRGGRVYIDESEDGEIWVGGDAVTVVSGEVVL